MAQLQGEDKPLTGIKPVAEVGHRRGLPGNSNPHSNNGRREKLSSRPDSALPNRVNLMRNHANVTSDGPSGLPGPEAPVLSGRKAFAGSSPVAAKDAFTCCQVEGADLAPVRMRFQEAISASCD